eukprot:gene7174-gene7851
MTFRVQNVLVLRLLVNLDEVLLFAARKWVISITNVSHWFGSNFLVTVVPSCNFRVQIWMVLVRFRIPHPFGVIQGPFIAYIRQPNTLIGVSRHTTSCRCTTEKCNGNFVFPGAFELLQIRFREEITRRRRLQFSLRVVRMTKRSGEHFSRSCFPIFCRRKRDI